LTPENIKIAIAQIRPYGVDVSSGVERAPGVKDHQKVRQFIARAKAAGLEATRPFASSPTGSRKHAFGREESRDH
jgi:phosphoribosylanthranilate isomerase